MESIIQFFKKDNKGLILIVLVLMGFIFLASGDDKNETKSNNLPNVVNEQSTKSVNKETTKPQVAEQAKPQVEEKAKVVIEKKTEVIEKKEIAKVEDKKVEDKKVSTSDACADKNADECFNLAFHYINGTGVKMDREFAVKLYEASCEKGKKEACYKAGVYHNRSSYGEKLFDMDKALVFFKKACDKGSPEGCFKVATLYQYSPSYNGEHKVEIVSYYKMACNAGISEGCTKLGAIYSQIHDYQGTKTWYKKACDERDKEGCYKLGDLYLKSLRNEKDDIKNYQGRCDKGDTEFCNKLGILYSRGLVMKQDYQKAKGLYLQSCNYEDNLGCIEYKQLDARGY